MPRNFGRRPLALTILMLVSALAGCVGTDTAAGVSFLTVYDRASSVAESWRDGARLIGAGAFESHDEESVLEGWEIDDNFLTIRPGSDNPENRIEVQNLFLNVRVESEPADQTIGDGRAIFWHFVFTDTSDGTHLAMIFLSGDQDPVYREVFPASMNIKGTSPIHIPSIDSDSAKEIALTDSEYSEFVSTRDDVYFIMSLMPSQIEGGLFWVIAAMTEDHHHSVVVDAENGELVHSGTYPSDRFYAFDWLWFAGLGGPGRTLFTPITEDLLTPLEPSTQFEFMVDRNQANGRPVWMVFYLCIATEPPGLNFGEVHIKLQAPSGIPYASDSIAGIIPESYSFLALASSEIGPYAAHLWLESPAGIVEYKIRGTVATHPVDVAFPESASDCL